MTNIIVGLVILLVVGAAVIYIIKEKKKGVKCIGCPAAAQCAAHRQNMNCRGVEGNSCNCNAYKE